MVAAIPQDSLTSLIQRYLEPIRITPEFPIYSKATVPLKGFRDEQTKNKK
jgi:hypothetical protein